MIFILKKMSKKYFKIIHDNKTFRAEIVPKTDTTAKKTNPLVCITQKVKFLELRFSAKGERNVVSCPYIINLNQ